MHEPYELNSSFRKTRTGAVFPSMNLLLHAKTKVHKALKLWQAEIGFYFNYKYVLNKCFIYYILKQLGYIRITES